jgi:hypothetical protein
MKSELKTEIEKMIFKKKLDGRLVNKILSKYKEVIEDIALGSNIVEKAYILYREIEEVPLCKICKNTSTFLNLKLGYSNTCNNKDCKNKWVQNCKENSVFQKYGVKNIFETKDVIEKIKANNLENYGSTTYIHSKAGTEKVKNSMLEKHGVENPMHSEKIKNKMIENSLKKRGTSWSLGSKEIQDKIKNTWEERGLKRNSSTKEWYENVISTNQSNYGVNFPAQSPEIYDKMLSSMYSRKEYNLPSGKIILIQGYENKTIDEFLKYYDEDDLFIGAKEIQKIVGSIEYFDSTKNKKRFYIPDMYIKSSNTIIETKSDRTFRIAKQTNLDKRLACLDKGLNFQFAIHVGDKIVDYDVNEKKYINFKF